MSIWNKAAMEDLAGVFAKDCQTGAIIDGEVKEFQAKREIDKSFYNHKRPHSSLAHKTPDGAYSSGKSTKFAA